MANVNGNCETFILCLDLRLRNFETFYRKKKALIRYGIGKKGLKEKESLKECIFFFFDNNFGGVNFERNRFEEMNNSNIELVYNKILCTK